MAMAMAMPGLLFLLLGLNLSVAEVAEAAIVVLMNPKLRTEKAVTLEPVMVALELPARARQYWVKPVPAVGAVELEERDGLVVPASISPAA